MPNPGGNRHIAEYGRATRFGAGNCPNAARLQARPPWSVRKVISDVLETRPLAHKKFKNCEEGIEKITAANFLRGLKRRGIKITLLHIAIVNLLILALSDYRAMKTFIRLTDGPPKFADQ